LRAADYVVIEARRDVAAGTAAVQADFTRDLSAREWLPKLRGVDAVINASAFSASTADQTFERIHKRAPQALFTPASPPECGASCRFPRWAPISA
jgi:hypothetical protein